MSADLDLLIVAGEASGDLHGARLLAELRQTVPGLRAFGLGGDELEAAGFEPLAHCSEIAVVGITEAMKILPRAWRIFRDLLAEVDRRGARTAVLIDSPDFNLRLAKKLHRRGVRVVYYISPQLWAWRKGRVKSIARTVERMLVVFSFEVGFYREHGVEAVHVGHPLLDEVPRLEHVWDRDPRPERYTVALLPGSRRSEVRVILPILLESLRQMAGPVSSPLAPPRGTVPLRARLIEAPTVPKAMFDELVAESCLPPGLEPERVTRDRFEAIADCHLALCASGTATVEVGLLGTPLVVVHRIGPVSYFLGRLLVDVEHAGMVNLVLGRGVAPELLQYEARPDRIASVAGDLLANPEAITAMRAALGELRERLGTSGASRRAAAEVAAFLTNGPGETP